MFRRRGAWRRFRQYRELRRKAPSLASAKNLKGDERKVFMNHRRSDREPPSASERVHADLLARGNGIAWGI